MKRTWFGYLLVLLCSFQLMYGQADSTFYSNKINKLNHLKTGGLVLTGVGTGLAIAGAAILIDLPSGYWSGDYTYDYTEKDEWDYLFQAVGGVVCTVLGVGMMAGGLTMTGIASKKIRFYQEQKTKLSLGIIVTPNRQGFTLTYRF